MAIEPFVPLAHIGATTEIVGLDGATPLRLDGGDRGWLVHSGRVDLFAVALGDGVPTGVRLPLCRIEAGELIAALPPRQDHRVIAVGELDTAVIPLTRYAPAGPYASLRAELIEQWLNRMAEAVFGAAPAWPDAVAEPGRRLPLAAGCRFYAGRDPAWIERCDTRLLIGDGPEEVGGIMPIAAGLGLRAGEAGAVEIVTTSEAFARGVGDAGLERFHRALTAALGTALAAAEAAGRARMAGRNTADRRSIDWAIGRLAGVAGRSAIDAEIEPPASRDPLVAALVRIAEQQGIELHRLPRAEIMAVSPMRAIARANRVGSREVLLRGTWWRADNGPLLAWRGAERRPVALLRSGRSYRLWEPSERSSTKVDAALAAEIAPKAVMVYRPLPPVVRGIAGLLRFAWRGVGGELATLAGTSVLTGLLAAAVPVAIGFLLDLAVPRAELGQVATVVAGLAIAVLGAAAFDLTKAVALLRLQGRLEAAMQPALLQRLLALPVNFVRGFGTGELTNRVLSIQTVRQLLAGNSILSILSSVSAMASLLVIVFYSPLLGLLSAALVSLAALVVGGLALGELREERARVALRGKEDDLAVQIVQGIAKLRAAAAEQRIFAQWAGLFSRQKYHFRRGRRLAAAAGGFAEVYPIVATLALYFVAARLVMAGDRVSPALGLAAFLAINAAFGQLLAAAMTMARTLAATLEIVPLFERLRPIVTAVPEAVDGKLEAMPLSGGVEVSHISFRYAEGAPLVLDDLSLSIAPGQFAAIVGPSGGGKSTLLRLLLGFEAAERGDILYDGQSIGALDAASLRRQIGVVLQQGRVASGSIFDNITGGLPYTLAEAWAAARLVGFDGDIEAMPMGMHTLLLEGSTSLSGGQRQRLLLARALIGRPRLLLFDEATSALDNQTQAVVSRSLAQLRTTRIVIAHRLSTVQEADRIFVIERGRLIEAGTFSELVGRDGLFSRLARRQII